MIDLAAINKSLVDITSEIQSMSRDLQNVHPDGKSLPVVHTLRDLHDQIRTLAPAISNDIELYKTVTLSPKVSNVTLIIV